MKFLKKYGYFFLFYGALFSAFLWPLVFLKTSFILGDYQLQFYPWSAYLAKALKTGQLPYWTNLIACGFPLVAEGQVAAYYPIHLIFYTILPFFAAYTWNIPLHILIGGLSFYGYTRRIGLKNEGAVLAAVIFSFSSAYGGCFYTTGTLRVLCWLPGCLWIIEELFWATTKKKTAFLVLVLGILIALMWTAGFPQAAFYAVGYLGLSVLLDKRRSIQMIFYLGVASIIGILLALPQILQTLELARVSVRAGETVLFALWGSVAPPAALSLFFPHWGSLMRVSFYIGIFPIFFIIWVLGSKKNQEEKKFLWLALVFFFLALGKFNPLYSFAVEHLSLTCFRNPAKFLFFTVLSFAVLAGFGYDKYLSGEGDRQRFWKIALALSASVVFLPVVGSWALNLMRTPILEYGHRYAESVYAAKAQAVHDLAYYHQLIQLFVDRLTQALALSHAWNLRTFAFVTAFLLLSWAYFKGRLSRSGIQWLIAAALIIDLFSFGHFIGSGFIGNAAARSEVIESSGDLAFIKEKLQNKNEKIVEWVVSQEKEIFPPGSNMFYDLPHAGGYSPLLIKRYYELTKDLGFVDSSLGRFPYSLEKWLKERALLDLLGVGIVIAEKPIDLPGLENVGHFMGRILYHNKTVLPRFHLVPNWKVIAEKTERLDYLKSEKFSPSLEAIVETNLSQGVSNNGWQKPPAISLVKDGEYELQVHVQADQDSVAIFQNVYYPAWQVAVDGKKETVMPVDHALMGVFLKKGEHTVYFYYDFSRYKYIEWFSAGLWLIILIGLVVLKRERKIEA